MGSSCFGDRVQGKEMRLSGQHCQNQDAFINYAEAS